jgi:hypothetical protein
MATKAKPPSAQLTLFDNGLDAPIAAPVRRRRREVVKRAQDVVVEEVQQANRVEILRPEDRPKESEPSPFERESYKLYLLLSREVRSLSIKTGGATLLIVALVMFGAQFDKAVLRFLEIRAVNHSLVVGVIGWLTIMLATYTLARGAFALKKKCDCGVFYQRVLHFSSNPFMRFIAMVGTAAYAALVVGAIVLVLILARHQMLDLVWFILRNMQHAFIGPWQTETFPGK